MSWHNNVKFKISCLDDFLQQQLAFEDLSSDLVIIDEAQNINSFDSDLVPIIRMLKYKELIIITDSQPENNLMQFYTLVGLVDNTLLTPLWEFSYQHCLFDSQVLDKIVGYYNQEKIVKRLETILLRRKKEDVSDQLVKPDSEISSDTLINSPVSLQKQSPNLVRKQLSADKYRQKRKSLIGQTSLFPLRHENKTISLSGEEHKVFETPTIKNVKSDIEIEKLLQNAQAFLEGLYTLQTGKKLPWKKKNIDLKINKDEVVLRIKR